MEDVHIGSLIREELHKQGRSNRWLADGIHVNMRTVNKIFHKEVIDTQRLMQISRLLGVDFFQYFSAALKKDKE